MVTLDGNCHVTRQGDTHSRRASLSFHLSDLCMVTHGHRYLNCPRFHAGMGWRFRHEPRPTDPFALSNINYLMCTGCFLCGSSTCGVAKYPQDKDPLN